MRSPLPIFVIPIFFFLPSIGLFAQNIFAEDDFITFTLGQTVSYNVTDNDSVPFGSNSSVFQTSGDTTCFFIDSKGELFFFGGQRCCGDFFLEYRYENCQEVRCTAFVFIQVLCKPECFLINIDEYTDDPEFQRCAYACENNTSTYYTEYNSSNTYDWTVTGGTFVAGANPAEIVVTWGPQGNGLVSLDITNSADVTQTKALCVEILESPVAGFDAPSSVCLEQPVTFTNTTVGGSGYFWDFGDGQTSTAFSPSHTYAAPGTYTVCLVATRQNFETEINAPTKSGGNQIGRPLCCCTDTICMDIVVDPLPSPNIYCISTLCAFDATEYNTDAANCNTYFWSVEDHLGVAVPFSGQGTSQIAVNWGDGPSGTVSLYVENCDDSYCGDTVSVVIPIISATASVSGPQVVCQGASETYTVQKWISATYNWTVNNGTIIAGQGTHSVVVQWSPFATGAGTVSVEYSSEFLGGLPGHDPTNCSGSADLLVEIRPGFTVNGGFPGTGCAGSTSNYSTSQPGAFAWSITPAATFTGQGTNSIIVTWDAGPGIFSVKAVPNDPAMFCNNESSRLFTVVEVPAPTGIEGPVDICPGQTYTYTAQSSEAGTGYSWTVTGGVATTLSGKTIDVLWNPTGPYEVSVIQTQLLAPFCSSDPFVLTVNPKLLDLSIAIAGPVEACKDAISSYSATPVQHPDTKYYWSVVPSHLGSVVSGQGTLNIDVQWSATLGMAQLVMEAELCGAMASQSIDVDIVGAAAPTITQSDVLCEGQSVMLNATPGFVTYDWSTGGSTASITINDDLLYTLTTTDANGCEATTAYQAVVRPGVVGGLPSLVVLCIPDNPAGVLIRATEATTPPPGYTFNWTLDGVNLGLPPTQNFVNHANTNVNQIFNYRVTITNSFGCSLVSSSNVEQTDNCPPACIPDPAFIPDFTFAPQLPNCNDIAFSAVLPPGVSVTRWSFDDPYSFATGGPVANVNHVYKRAGCYNVRLFAVVPALGGGFCDVVVEKPVCVSFAADFDFAANCGTVNFTSITTGGLANTWNWSFGDGNTAATTNATHAYAPVGTYAVTLTATEPGGCQATVTKNVNSGGIDPPVIGAAPNPACVDEPIAFTGASGAAVSWLWDFGETPMTINTIPALSHTYVADGVYNISLTVESVDGCTNTTTLPFTVNLLPPDDVITALPGLKVCDGTASVLTAPAGVGYTYLWSNGEMTQSINATTSGEYSVVVTDANGCTMEPEPVTVVVVPLPPADISGSPFICDFGCTELEAPAGDNYTYQWFDAANTVVSTFREWQPCVSTSETYRLEVTDNNTGCVNTSPTLTVNVVPSPFFSLFVDPDFCEGKPITLEVTPTQPDVAYTWSTGETGISIVVQQAGTYTVIGTDQITGCTNTGSVTINPLPDLCIVPVGCYTACDPDTLCGPDGLTAYQWFKDGAPIPGATDQCLIASENGVYSLSGANTFGCTDASDALELTFVNCSCLGPTTVTATCPPNVSVDVPAGITSAVVTYPQPTATTDCACPGLTFTRTSGLASGGDFPLGTTQVCYEVKDSCQTTASCCFTVTVNEVVSQVCDAKAAGVGGCLKYELIGITRDASGDKTYRIRVTNNCADPLELVTFQLPNGVNAVRPASGSYYTAPSGRAYLVRNPNATPQHSIRFRPAGTGISGGASDVFQYTLPEQSSPAYINTCARLSNNPAYLCAHLNTFFCPITFDPDPWSPRPDAFGTRAPGLQSSHAVYVYPNPADDVIFVNTADWQAEWLYARIINTQGQVVFEQALAVGEQVHAMQLGNKLTAGLYFVLISDDAGRQETLRVTLQH
ncbi:MAG: PKD domain-containing protein [Saprospiraceae bacterium]|nr:PKD domain-containing protein [Saprospiraceae bacterium]